MTVRGRDKRDKARTGRDKPTTKRYAARSELETLATDRLAPASARVTAVRTLAEMDGLIGKHQAPPDKLPTASLASLSRDELVSELGRLRALNDIGLLP